jgi:hypothetical protein
MPVERKAEQKKDEEKHIGERERGRENERSRQHMHDSFRLTNNQQNERNICPDVIVSLSLALSRSPSYVSSSY